VRNASAHKPCSASARAQRSAGDTHVLRDGDEAGGRRVADDREQAAAMPAESGEWRQSDPSPSNLTGWPLAWVTNIPPSQRLFLFFAFSLSLIFFLSSFFIADCRIRVQLLSPCIPGYVFVPT
jgi:hypothetical protein